MTRLNVWMLALVATLFGIWPQAAQAQPLSFTSAIDLGGNGNDQGTGVAVDGAGNVYITGTCSGAVDFDPGPGTVMIGLPGPFNAFVAKYAPSGTLLWAYNHVAGVSNSYALAVDGAGNVYTAGWFTGTNDFDPGPGTFNITDINGPNLFVSKLDSSGKLVWAKGMFGGTATPSSIAIDAAGNVYTSGYLWSGTIDFDPGPGTVNLTNAGNQLFLSKLDSSGNFVWVLNFAGTQALNGNGLALDAAGNVYATANFQGTVDLDPGPGVANFTASIRDPFVIKLTPAGTYVWAKQLTGGIGAGFATALVLDAAGNVLSTGYFVGTMDFDPGPGTSALTAAGGGTYDVYISKLDNNGNFIWARGLGGVGEERAGAITVDGAGNVYTVGYYGLGEATADFDPGPGTFNLTPVGSYDIFVSLLDSAGNFLGAAGIGSTQWDQGNAIAVSPFGVVYATGYFQLTADFDPGPGILNLTSAGNQDIFVLGLRAAVGAPPPPPSPSKPPPGGEGSFAAPKAPGGEGGFRVSSGLSIPPRGRAPVLAGPFIDGQTIWRISNVSYQQQTSPAGEKDGSAAAMLGTVLLEILGAGLALAAMIVALLAVRAR